MKDLSGPTPSNGHGPAHHHNGSRLANGSVVDGGKLGCRRRAFSGGGAAAAARLCNGAANGDLCGRFTNGLLTAPHVEPPPPVAAVDEGFVEADLAGDGGGVVTGWAVPTRVQILRDLANLCTFTGAILATLAMACMWKGRYYLGMCLNVAASLADIIDGPIARSTPGRHPSFSIVGSKLDCYSDVVSHFVVPASLLMHISDLNAFCTALAALYICAGILRHSLFEVTGRCENGTCIYGMTSDYNVTVYVLAMHLLSVVGRDWMLVLLSAVLAGLSAASLTFILRSRRYAGVDLSVVAAFNVSLCGSCVGLLVWQHVDAFGWISAALFVVHAALAYPCYFRFVELNA